MTGKPMVRPELVGLGPVARQKVLDEVAVKGGRCGSCGGTDFEVGYALYLGYLFLDEDSDAYMVALTCRTTNCTQPRTAIVLPEKAFLSDGEEARAATWLAGAPGGA
jgi:hypothetical protein